MQIGISNAKHLQVCPFLAFEASIIDGTFLSLFFSDCHECNVNYISLNTCRLACILSAPFHRKVPLLAMDVNGMEDGTMLDSMFYDAIYSMTFLSYHDHRKPNKCVSLVASCKIDRFCAEKLIKHCSFFFFAPEVRAMADLHSYHLSALLFYIRCIIYAI